MRRIIGSGTFCMFMFLGHAVGSYSKGDPQLRRHCGRDIDDLDDSDRVAGRNAKDNSFPNEESLIYPPAKPRIFHKKETGKY